MSDSRLLEPDAIRATLKRIHAASPDAWKDADLLRNHIEAQAERIRALEALAQPLLDAGFESNEPYWSEEEDVVQTTEWWPVPGAARRALWGLRK